MDSPRTATDLVHQAIAAGIFGQIQWNDSADQRARSNPDLQGLIRPDWLQANADRPPYYRDWWYRAVVPVPDLFAKGLFVEVRLFDDDPQDPWVEIVNAHP